MPRKAGYFQKSVGSLFRKQDIIFNSGANGAIAVGSGMIDVIIADHQEVFRVGMAEVLGAADDIRVVGKPDCPKALLAILTTVNPHVLILSRVSCERFRRSGGC